MTTYSCFIKKYHELTLDNLFDILEKRVEVFVCEQHFLCQELDYHDKECYHVMFYDDTTHQLIAYCRTFKDDNSDDWLVGRVFVVKSHRKKNIGIDLMKKTVEHVLSLNPENQILVHSQTQAQVFYEKCHFVTEGDIFIEEGCPHIMMRYKPE